LNRRRFALERERGEGFNKDQNDRGVLKEIRVFSKHMSYPPKKNNKIVKHKMKKDFNIVIIYFFSEFFFLEKSKWIIYM